MNSALVASASGAILSENSAPQQPHLDDIAIETHAPDRLEGSIQSASGHNDYLTINGGIVYRSGNMQLLLRGTIDRRNSSSEFVPQATLDYKTSPNSELRMAYNTKLSECKGPVPTFAIQTSYHF